MNKFVKFVNTTSIILFTITTLFYPAFSVRAETPAKLKSSAPDSLALRDGPTNKNTNVIGAIGKNEIVYILEDQKYSGDGCSSGWYKLKYNDLVGYACSTYITTDLADAYDRPWNTPKKAIYGGAKFIGGTYISKGQFTSYLKKFNVNPNSAYGRYNHLYQANITAPKTEAVSSSKSYIKNNVFTLPFTFSIPVYEQMAESYPHPTGEHANLGTTDVTDDAFEEMIKDFPVSYKPYLRQLHQEHNNWTFTPMNTGVTIEEAAEIFKTTGAIQSTNKKIAELDENGNIVATNEKGWNRPNSAVTRYYLDPRNFLNETYVFMFENLAYMEVDENVVQGVLNSNSLLKGMDTIDNQSYASLFKEAGKEYGVNPVYLAALSVIEVGSHQFLVDGSEFDYDGVKYSGLFNFFNIGAYSSASNPARSGLIYASGGYCTICATYTPSENQGDSSNVQVPTYNKETSINNIGAAIKGNYISGFAIGSQINDIKAKDSNTSFNSDGVVKTGQVVTFADGSSYTVVVYGDLNGDGNINSADLLKLRQHLLGKSVLSNEFLEAANFNGDNNINSASLLKVRQFLLGKTNINQK